jgi:hypothetical protein
MKIFTLLLLLSTLIFANNFKKIAVIPANVNYDIDSVQEFSELLYDSVINAVAQYNFSQTNPSKMYQIRGPFLAEKKYAQRIKNFHIALRNNSSSLMLKHHLEKLLVMDFSTNQVRRLMRRCKHSCNVTVSFTEYSLGKKPVSKKVTYKYAADTCLLTDKSMNSLNESISSYLSK